MKNNQESLPPDVSRKALTSDGSKYYDQEMGSNTTSTRQDVPIKSSKLCGFACGVVDLTLARMVLAEALGTFILMFCICGIIASMNIMGSKVGLLEYAITAALTVTVVIFSIGTISGAHVNPAVTLAFAIAGPFPWSKVPLYILAQIGGSVLATYVGKLVYGIKSELVMTRPLIGCASAFWVELIATFILMFLSAALINELQSVRNISGFVAGVAIGLAVLITGPISGGSMNPARSLGPAIISWKFDGIWIYLTAPTIGAVLGVISFRSLCLHCNLSNFTSPDQM